MASNYIAGHRQQQEERTNLRTVICVRRTDTNYKGNITPIRSEISRFSRGTDEKRAHRGSHHDFTNDRNPCVFRSYGVFGIHSTLPPEKHCLGWSRLFRRIFGEVNLDDWLSFLLRFRSSLCCCSFLGGLRLIELCFSIRYFSIDLA
jgi:hypothetical protein